MSPLRLMFYLKEKHAAVNRVPQIFRTRSIFMPARPETGLTPMLIGMLRADAATRKRVAANPDPVARRHGVSAETVGFYLKMMGEK